MRRSIILFILIFSLTFSSSCAKDIKVEESVGNLLDSGFTVVTIADDPSELDVQNASFNSRVKFNGGNFEINIVKFTSLNKISGEDYLSCQFIEFASIEQAENYYNLYIEKRVDTDNYRLRLFENIIVYTNSEEAIDIVGGKFN